MPITEKIDLERLASLGLEVMSGGIERQTYEKTKLPQGVVPIENKVFLDGQGGHFLESSRTTEDGYIKMLQAKGILFKPRQTNFALAAPGTKKLGHLHPEQDELWVVGDGQLTVALCDFRTDSKTIFLKSKVVLGPGMGLYIPHGVAHGLANFTRDNVSLTYFASHEFSPGEDSQEFRFIPLKGTDFWDFVNPEET